jgi:hypothetical protein
MSIGHKFIQKEFGIRPRIGWQLDSYGHSATNARLFAEMGIDALFFSRGDIDDYEQRKLNQELEFVYRPYWETLGESA